MSYNITSWKTTKLSNLVIPVNSFFVHSRKDWHPSIVMVDAVKNKVRLGNIMDSKITGTIIDGSLHVSKLNISGEGSGTLMSYIFEHCLKNSTGILQAMLIWEGGDSISRISVVDGVMIDEDLSFESDKDEDEDEDDTKLLN